jgi:dihydrofolate reductase
MAKLTYGLNVSLDGYADHDMAGAIPGPVLFRHFTDHVRDLAGSLYGRTMYGLMRVWDDDIWQGAEADFAAAWRGQHKYVVSQTLKEVGPNASLLDGGNLEAAVRRLKAEVEGEIDVGGPVLAQALTELGLIDEYRMYLHPVVPGRGKPFFLGPRPPLHLVSTERFDEDVIRLTYVPA